MCTRNGICRSANTSAQGRCAYPYLRALRCALRIAFCRLMRLISLFDVNHRFWRTMGRILASATDLRKRRSRLSCDSPGRSSTLIGLTPLERYSLGVGPVARLTLRNRTCQSTKLSSLTGRHWQRATFAITLYTGSLPAIRSSNWTEWGNEVTSERRLVYCKWARISNASDSSRRPISVRERPAGRTCDHCADRCADRRAKTYES